MNSLLLALALAPMIFREDFAGDNLVVRPMEKTIVGLDLKQINDFRRARNSSLDIDAYCFIQTATSDSLVLTERGAQASLEEMFRESDATFDMMVAGGIRLTIGVYEKCTKPSGSGKVYGTAIVATKAGKLLWFDENDGAAPLFLFRSKGKHLAVVSSCMFCGEVTEIYYDAANDKFYTQYTGD